jgi:hypothetical protein
MKRVLAGSALLVVAAISLTGCSSSSNTPSASGSASAPASTNDNGVSQKSAADILKATQAAAAGQSSVHAAGVSPKFSMDLDLAKGQGASGTITIGTQKAQLVADSKDIYIKGSADFWKGSGGGAGAALLGDKWIKISLSSTTGKNFDTVSSFASLVTGSLKSSSALTKGPTGDVAGQPAISLTDATKGALWVATTGEPLPLKVTSDSNGSTLTYSNWGAPVVIKVPTGSDVIDFSKLTGVK